ncbi:MAG: exodeoxyribonuclease III [Alphaproteobacteria bacterium]|nr:exodeoxyribonuclease III [Alphaproteobacteria bacterium]
MQIISWNVASVRARLNLIIELLKEKNPDVLFLQEIKATDETFPFEHFNQLGYRAIISGQKSFNGVAILTKLAVSEPLYQLPTWKGEIQQARFVQTTYKNIRFISVYIPNGNPPEKDPTDTSRLTYKLDWMKALTDYLKNLSALKLPFIIGGDFNVIEKDYDVYNPELYRENALMLPRVRDAFSLLNSLPITNTLRHLNKEPHLYSFWDFQGGAWQKNLGMLLDHIFVSKELESGIKFSGIYKDYRGKEKPSDHTPIFCQIDL